MHCPGKGVAAENYIPANLLGTGRSPWIELLPVDRGGIVLFNRYTQHAALTVCA